MGFAQVGLMRALCGVSAEGWATTSGGVLRLAGQLGWTGVTIPTADR